MLTRRFVHAVDLPLTPLGYTIRTTPEHTSVATTMLLRTAFRPRPSPFFLRTRPLLLAFGISIPLLQPRPVTRLDTSPNFSSSGYTHSRDAKTPLTRDGNTLNPAAVKQISLGSILGLGCGLVLSAFSTSLTLLLGLGIVVWQV